MSRSLYLGREYDPKSGSLGPRMELDSSDLLTHGLIVGMTGSGKTGLAIALIEELLRQGVPVLAIESRALPGAHAPARENRRQGPALRRRLGVVRPARR